MVTNKSKTTSSNSVSKKNSILDASEHLLAQQGFHGMTMQKLAKNANVAAGTIYRYFDDKEQLIECVRLRVLQRVADILQHNLDDSDSIRVQFNTMCRNIWELTKNEVDTILNRFQYESLPSTNANFKEIEKKMFYKVDKLFEQGKEESLFKPLESKILVMMSFEVNFALARKYTQCDCAVDEEILEMIIQSCWDAVTTH